MKTQNTKHKTQEGFILPLSMIVISIVLTASMSISILIMGEIEFSILSRESQRAFFAADAGTECALYWDLRGRAFQIEVDSLLISCVGLENFSVPNSDNIWHFTLSFSNGSRAEVYVDKTNYPITQIRSYGYNKDAIGGGDLVERALRVTY